MVVGELGHEILILGQRVMGQYAHLRLIFYPSVHRITHDIYTCLHFEFTHCNITRATDKLVHVIFSRLNPLYQRTTARKLY